MRYLVIRLALVLPQLFGVAVLMFLITHLLPGDPVQALVGDFAAPPAYVAQLKHDFGLDQPITVQFVRYIENLAQGNLGYSFSYREPVTQVIGGRIGATLLLTASALVISAFLGIAMGVAAATRRGSMRDTFVVLLSVIGFAVPSFWLGQILIVFFASKLGWFPATGMVDLRASAMGFGHVVDVADHLLLPAFALALGNLALTARLTRGSVLDVLGEDYVRTARAKGLSTRIVTYRHVLRNALLPVLTALGYNVGFLLSGSALVETVFGWPGMGRLLYDSLFRRDNSVLMGIFLTISLMAILANLLTDLIYSRVDPRIKYS